MRNVTKNRVNKGKTVQRSVRYDEILEYELQFYVLFILLVCFQEKSAVQDLSLPCFGKYLQRYVSAVPSIKLDYCTAIEEATETSRCWYTCQHRS